ncbi:MAG: hypothetical protein M1498_03810 [Candidatus Thermoplasmatota archaeon]|nr:hypothetical protein [Candidatus Thermoplasmatota archaeon]
MTMEEYQAMEETQEMTIIRDFFETHQLKGYTVSQLLLYIQAILPETTSMELHKITEILYHQHVLERKKSGHHYRYRTKKK